LKFRFTGAQIYIKYKLLKTSDIGYILLALEEIKNEVSANLESDLGGPFEKKTLLVVDNMFTGNSITINLWGTEIEIDPENKYMIAVAVIATLIGAFKAYNDYRLTSAQIEKTHAETEGQTIENELKKNQLQKEKEDWEAKKDTTAGKLTEFLVQNELITSLYLNKKKVK
jgi:hypothetical protein